MAKRKVTSLNYSDSFNRATRNRGEEFNEPQSNLRYDYRPANTYSDASQERAPRRYEMRDVYSKMYEVEQRRDQRDFARTRDMTNEFFAGVDPRRREELADGGMVREDLGAMANLPRQAIHCEYPQASFYATPYLDDSERGVTDRPDDNGSSMARFLNPYNDRPAY